MTMEKKHHGLVGDTIHRLIHAFMAQITPLVVGVNYSSYPPGKNHISHIRRHC